MLRYFFQGILMVAPLLFTVYIIYWTVVYLDSLIDVGVPGLGMLIVITGLTLVGFVGSTYLARSLFSIFEKALTKIPLVSFLYTSIKDILQAFVGDEQRFNQAVLLTVEENLGLQKVGFITQEDLEHFNVLEKVAVYCPHSYNFSGNLYIAPRKHVQVLDIPSSDAMKFAVSGGMSMAPPPVVDKVKKETGLKNSPA